MPAEHLTQLLKLYREWSSQVSQILDLEDTNADVELIQKEREKLSTIEDQITSMYQKALEEELKPTRPISDYFTVHRMDLEE